MICFRVCNIEYCNKLKYVRISCKKYNMSFMNKFYRAFEIYNLGNIEFRNIYMHHMMIKSLFFLDVLRNVGSSPIISSSSSLFGGSSNQSPVGGTPIQLSNCSTQPPTTSSSLQQNNSQLQHTTYVDQRGRSTLIKPATPARELPV